MSEETKGMSKFVMLKLAIVIILLVVCSVVIFLDLKLIPETKPVIIYDIKIKDPTAWRYVGEPEVPMGTRSLRNPYGVWSLLNTSEGKFSSRVEFMFKEGAWFGSDCPNVVCFPPTGYNITLYRSLLGDYQNFAGYTEVVVTE